MAALCLFELFFSQRRLVTFVLFNQISHVLTVVIIMFKIAPKYREVVAMVLLCA